MNSLPADAPVAGASPPERGSATPPPRQRFAFAPDAFRLGRARRRVRDYLSLYCRDEVCVDDVVLCVHEACANAVRHGGSRADIEVFLGFHGGDLQIVVRDHGHGFDTSRFDPRELPNLLSERGWGLFLMSRLCDEMELRSDGGLEVRLVKRGATTRGTTAEAAPAQAGAAPAQSGAAPLQAEGALAAAETERDELRSGLESAETERDELRSGLAAAETERDELRGALEAAQARFDALVAGLAEGVAVHELVERDGEVVDYRTLQVNAAFERQSGLSAAQVCGRRAGELSASGRAPRLDEYAWVAASGEPFDFETWVEETQRHLTVRAVALGGGRFATVSSDVTDRRRADDDLRRAGELAGIAAQERRRAEEQRAHVAAELRRLADESAAVGDELRARDAELAAHAAQLDARRAQLAALEAQLGAREAQLGAREDRARGVDEALRVRSADLDARERELGARDDDLSSRERAWRVRDAGQPGEAAGGEEARELAERVELGEELDGVDRLLRSGLGLEELLQAVLDAGVAALAADAGTVELRDGEAWVVRSQSGLGPEVVGARQGSEQAPNALRALKYREPFATADMQAARTDVGPVAERGLRAVLAVPLVVRDEVIGLLSFYGRAVRVFDDPEIDFGRRLGAGTALAIDNARLRDEAGGTTDGA